MSYNQQQSSHLKPGIGLRNHTRLGGSDNSYWRALKNTLPSTNSDKDTLPLYKDKPMGSSSGYSAQRASSSRLRRTTIFKGALLFFTLYFIYFKFFATTADNDGATDWKEKQLRVKQAFRDTWESYEKDAWGKDVYNPISGNGKNMGPLPLGWIIVDSLDTLLIMGLEEEFKTAQSWVENELTYDFDYDVNVFETTIRMLGGLLSAFYLSGNDMFLEKATDLGNRIIGAFESPSGLPYASVNLKTGQGKRSHADGGASSTAEVSTLQLEFKYLSKLTGESLYWEKVERIMKELDDNHPRDGLAPIYVHPDTGKYQGNLIRLGSRGDSYYEYLLKQYLQTEEREPVYNAMYQESVRGMKDHLLKRSKPNGLAFLGELENGIDGPFSTKMDHLVCFIGGLFALGATEGETLTAARKSSNWDNLKEADMLLAKDITHTCWKMYEGTATGLAPEIVVFNTNEDSTEDFHIKKLDKHNLQRPETVESLFILWRITKDPIYRKWGWEIFQSFEKHTKTSKGSYTSLEDVTTIPAKQRDNMESFWLAETLKYLYLLFDDSEEEVLPLNKVIFNTEAHPFPIFEMNPLFKTGWTRSENAEKPGVRKEINDGFEDGEKLKQSLRDMKKAKEISELGKSPKLENAPIAAHPAKPAIDELKEVEAEEKPSQVEKKLSDGENVNDIIEKLIEEEV